MLNESTIRGLVATDYDGTASTTGNTLKIALGTCTPKAEADQTKTQTIDYSTKKTVTVKVSACTIDSPKLRFIKDGKNTDIAATFATDTLTATIASTTTLAAGTYTVSVIDGCDKNPTDTKVTVTATSSSGSSSNGNMISFSYIAFFLGFLLF